MVFQVQGSLTAQDRDRALRRAIRTALESGARSIVVNLDGVTVVDSSGVADLATSQTAVTKHGGRLTLCHLSQKMKEIFVITRLDKVFQSYETEADAIAALTAQT
jgi:anti-sigma B factor antagonist